MTRWIALGVLGAAGLLYATAAVPLQRQAAAAADEYRKTRDERREVRTRLARLQRREAVQRHAAQVIPAGATPGDTVRAVRRVVVQTVASAGLSGVRLGVRPGRAPVLAEVHLSTEGPFGDVVRLCGLLTRGETGLVLSQLRLTPRSMGAALDLDAVVPGTAP
jgi:hypothetical protein